MNILVLTMDYPRLDGTHERMFVHVRDMYYSQNGINVTVLNFASPIDYEIDGIKVITLQSYKKSCEKYDVLVSHASNLRNHYRFLRKFDKRFSNIVFFFHGHEVLYLNKDYPKPYSFVKRSWLSNGLLQDVYDHFKILLWSKYYKKYAYKCQFVFVSNWIKNRFKKNLHFEEEDFNGHSWVINNSIGASFEESSYNVNAEKKYDFITIRSNLDGSKYGVDLVVDLAKKYVDKRFLLIGRGKYFEFNEKPDNIDLISNTLNHNEMLQYLDVSRCGLLLTREDTQGVMTCEFASYGLPTITSNIDVCHEFFETMPNVEMINNNLEEDIVYIREKLESRLPYPKDTRFFAQNTISKEIELLKKITKESLM